MITKADAAYPDNADERGVVRRREEKWQVRPEIQEHRLSDGRPVQAQHVGVAECVADLVEPLAENDILQASFSRSCACG